jgi:hypothetical protein
MATRNQLYLFEADWDLLRKCVAYPSRYPHGVCLDHRYFEDLRKYYWWLSNFPLAGLMSEKKNMWNDSFVPVYYNSSNPSPGILRYAGDKIVTTWDTSHGMGNPIRDDYGNIVGWSGQWLWWLNNIHLYKESYNVHNELTPEQKENVLKNLRPPTATWNATEERWETKIHTDSWIPDNPAGYAQNIQVSFMNTNYRSKRVVEDLHTTPDKNTADWEVYDSCWITSNSYWELTDSPNEYHTCDVNSPFNRRYSLIVVQGDPEFIGSEIVIESDISNKPYVYLPPQFDPKGYYKQLIYIGSEKQAFQHREKVKFESKLITNPERLGAVFDDLDRMGFYQVWYATGTRPPHIKRHDTYGILGALDGQFHHQDCPGNQYINFGGHWYDNTTGDPEDNEWTANPKLRYDLENDSYPGLQNYLEVVLCSSVFSWPMDYLYMTNAGITSDDEIYPGVNDEAWGENENGFELYLKKRAASGGGGHDWYFDMEHPWIPSTIVEYAYGQAMFPYVGSDSSWISPEILLEKWDCYPVGTYRRTWMHTLGRKTPWIRSYEMGTPAHRKDAWNPQFSFTYEGHSYGYTPTYGNRGSGVVSSNQCSRLDYDSSSKWMGARTNQMPLVTDFDNTYRAITAFELEAIAWIDGGTYLAGAFCSDNGYVYYSKVDVLNKNTAPSQNPDEWVNVTNYTFAVDGNLTIPDDYLSDYLKDGWQIHIASELNAPIDECSAEYILAYKYDETLDKTIFMMSSQVPISGFIYWNRDVCTRHDGINATWEIDNDTGALTYEINYWPTVELLLEMMNDEQLPQYVQVNAEWDGAAYLGTCLINIGSGPNSADENYGKGIAVMSSYASRKLAEYRRIDDEAIETNYTYNEWLEEPEAFGYDEYGWPNTAHVMGGWQGYYGGLYVDFFIGGTLYAYDCFERGTLGYDWVAVWQQSETYTALKAEWPIKRRENYEDTEYLNLSDLPDCVTIKCTQYRWKPVLFDDNNDNQYTLYGKECEYGQKCEVAGVEIGTRLGSTYPDYNNQDDPVIRRFPIAASGSWFVAEPKVKKTIYRVGLNVGTNSIERLANGFGRIWAEINFEDMGALVHINGDFAKEKVWRRSMVGHIDCMPLDEDDTTAPFPNPAQWWYKPYVDIQFNWNTVKFEVYLRGKICLCEDLERTLVKYRMTCVNNPELNTAWSTSREHEVRLPDIESPHQSIAGLDGTYEIVDFIHPTVTIINIVGDYTEGDVVFLHATGDGLHGGNVIGTVDSYADNTLIIKYDNQPAAFEFINELHAVFGSGDCIYNISRCDVVDDASWAVYAGVNTFRPQAKDSAFIENIGLEGAAESPAKPEKYPPQIALDMVAKD